MARLGVWGIARGAGSGTGRALSEHLTKAGHSVVGITRGWRSEEPIPGIDVVEIDFQKSVPDLRTFAEKVGELDALVLCAGYGVVNSITSISLTDIERMSFANFQLPAIVLKYAVHCTRHVILTASIAGVRQREGSSVYAGTKAGVLALADSARKELPDHFIQTLSFDNVNAVGPKKVLAAYDFLLSTPSNTDVAISR